MQKIEREEKKETDRLRLRLRLNLFSLISMRRMSATSYRDMQAYRSLPAYYRFSIIVLNVTTVLIGNITRLVVQKKQSTQNLNGILV